MFSFPFTFRMGRVYKKPKPNFKNQVSEESYCQIVVVLSLFCLILDLIQHHFHFLWGGLKFHQLQTARDQGLMAETCCAEENKLSNQMFTGLSRKRSGKINKKECLGSEYLAQRFNRRKWSKKFRPIFLPPRSNFRPNFGVIGGYLWVKLAQRFPQHC